MSIPVIAFFNNKGGVGQTSLAYHLSWMLADQGFRVLAMDLDPQANLTAAFLEEDRLEEMILGTAAPPTVFGAVNPLRDGGDIAEPQVEAIADRLGLVPGDLRLSDFEDLLSEVWTKCLSRDPRAFRVISAFWRVAQRAGTAREAEVILVDLGPNLGAINRAALIASDFVVIPLGPDLFSLLGLRNLGPALRRWREEWRERLPKNPLPELALPTGTVKPLGYVVLRQAIRLDRPAGAFDRWLARIPATYAASVLGVPADASLSVDADPHCLAKLRDYRSLMPLAQEARKPMFFLRAADGALGAHASAVSDAYRAFAELAKKVATAAGLRSPS